MYENPLKAKLQKNAPITGLIVQGALPVLVEIGGVAGFDFVFIDCEHGPLSVGDCENLVRAAEVRRTIPVIRVPENTPEVILRYMDIGAMGVIVPGIATADEAELALRAVKYQPRGDRGLSATRASDYGLTKPISQYVLEANAETVVMVVIESQKAVDNIAKILCVDGIDAAIIGTTDLSHSLGVPGQGNHPKVQDAFQKALEFGLPTGKTLGAVVRSGETPKIYRDRGVNLVLTSAYGLLAAEAKRFVASAKE